MRKEYHGCIPIIQMRSCHQRDKITCPSSHKKMAAPGFASTCPRAAAQISCTAAAPFRALEAQ